MHTDTPYKVLNLNDFLKCKYRQMFDKNNLYRALPGVLLYICSKLHLI